MNVLLAEANVPYDKLKEMDEINPGFANTDVALVIGANDVVNPAARTDPSSPIYGMPILNVDHAKHVIVLKRSMNAGFAGIENELFFGEKTSMLFGDAKASLTKLVGEIKSLWLMLILPCERISWQAGDSRMMPRRWQLSHLPRNRLIGLATNPAL